MKKIEDDFCNFVLEAILDIKSENNVVIDISEVTLMADFMIVCSGRSRAHVQGIANSLIERSKKENYKVYNVDGTDSGEWILVDLGTIIVHVMQDETRNFYKLEKLWSNGKLIYSDENVSLEAKKA